MSLSDGSETLNISDNTGLETACALFAQAKPSSFPHSPTAKSFSTELKPFPQAC